MFKATLKRQFATIF